MGRKAQKNDSLPGSLDMLILRTLSRRELHGYGIVQFIHRRARIYKITALGRNQLAIETRKSDKLTLAIARVMEAE